MQEVPAALRELMKAREIPRLLVLDPTGAWSGWEAHLSILPEGREIVWRRDGQIPIRALRLTTLGDLGLAMDVAWVIVPPSGLDQAARRDAERLRETERPLLAAAPVTESELRRNGRSEPGYDALCREVQRELGIPLLLIPVQHPGECVQILRQAIHCLGPVARSSQRISDLRRLTEGVAEFGLGVLALPSEREALGWTRLAARRIWLERPGEWSRSLCEARAGATADVCDALEGWAGACQRAKRRCRPLGRGEAAAGELSEEIVGELIEVLAAFRKQMARHFEGCHGRALVGWAEATTTSLDRPSATVPVVGVFSSGKTTLFNDLLGPLQDGKAHLQTQHTHNTAGCDDGNPCTTGEACDAGACTGGSPPPPQHTRRPSARMAQAEDVPTETWT